MLDAVRTEVVAAGYGALTVDVIAARGGIHRTTVHRRGRDAGVLLADVPEAARDDDGQPRGPEALGSLRGIAGAGEAARAVRRLWEDRYRTSCA